MPKKIEEVVITEAEQEVLIKAGKVIRAICYENEDCQFCKLDPICKLFKNRDDFINFISCLCKEVLL